MKVNQPGSKPSGQVRHIYSDLCRWWQGSLKTKNPAPGRLFLEEFESRLVLSASISGTVFRTVDIIDPNKKTADPGIPGIKVILDGNTANPQITDSQGNYSFGDVSSDQQHTVSVQLPPDLWGFSAQSLSYSINLGSNPFSNLNFALTNKTQALVQNLYQQVLVRSSDVSGLNGWTKSLNSGSTTGGQVFASFLGSSEFQSTIKPIANVLGGFFPDQPLDSNLLRNNIQIARAGITKDANVLNILYSQPFIAKFGDTSALTNTQFVTFLYNKLLHRAPDSAGLNYWVGQLSSTTSPLNRGQVVLGFTGGTEFLKRNPEVGNEATVSLAYLGLLGRTGQQTGFNNWVNYLNAGNSVAALGNQMLGSPEFAKLKGFNDIFLSDIKSYPIPSAVNPLNRLQMYDPEEFTFDKPVTAGSLTGQSGSNPSNVYVIAHGWAPGFAQDVLIHSTPGNPLKWWDTVKYPGTLDPAGPASLWMFQGVEKVSVESMAQAIVDSDPKAQVILYSWIDDSGTPGEGAFSLQNAVSLEDDVPFISQSEANTQLNGLRMAAAIKDALGAQFFANQGLIHLMGHSHGSRVATLAALTLQKANVPVTQLTTLESPESGSLIPNVTGLVNARNFLWYYMQQMNLSRSPLEGNSRTPNSSTFIDNYWSVTGVGMPFAGYQGLGSVVDSAVTSIPISGLNPVAGHTYPAPWYGQSGLVNPLSNISTTMTGAGITTTDTTATVTVSGNSNFPGTGQDGFFIQVDNEIMQVTKGAGTNIWTLGARGLNGTTPATHTNLSSPVTLLQNNGLQWSPLINPTLAQNLISGYYQGWTNYNFNQQFLLSPNIGNPVTLPTPVSLQYATQYKVGTVTDTGSSITLSADAANPLALAAMTFTPISKSATGQSGTLGSGLGFEFQFTNAGEGDRLVVWERGMFGLSAPGAPDGPIDTGTLGYRTVPLFVMTAQDAGSVKQKAILNLDAFFNKLTPSPLALGMFHNTQLPTFGFSLIRGGNSSSTVTVTNLQQLNDGSGG